MVAPRVGVLALQGGFDPHLRMLRKLGSDAAAVLTAEEIDGCGALVLPGGESTTMGKLLVRYGLLDLVANKIRAGTPVFGTCAGMILLAREIAGYPDQPGLRVLDITVERNAYGRQLESFEGEVIWKDDSVTPGVFIRAPRVIRLGPGVEVLAEREDIPVLVRAGNVLAASFHPELTDNAKVHRTFLEMIKK